MSTGDVIWGFVAGILALAMIVSASYNIGKVDKRKEMQTEAVERGVAKWEVSSDGKTTFKWLHEKKEKTR
jgi:hypothetical protein